MHATIAKRGEVPLSLVDLYVDTINDAIRDRPPAMTVVIHMCRGNEGVAGLGSGGYDGIAERVFGSSTSMGICSSTTRRAPATSPRCVSCSSTPSPSAA